MADVKVAEKSVTEIIDKNELPFIIERVNPTQITLSPRIKGASKQQRKKFNQVSRILEIAVFDDEKIEKFESIKVEYPETISQFEKILKKLQSIIQPVSIKE